MNPFSPQGGGICRLFWWTELDITWVWGVRGGQNFFVMDFGPIGSHLWYDARPKVFAPMKHTLSSRWSQKWPKFSILPGLGNIVPGVCKYVLVRIRSRSISSGPSLIKCGYKHLQSTSRTDFIFPWKLLVDCICPKTDWRVIHCKNTRLWRKCTKKKH